MDREEVTALARRAAAGEPAALDALCDHFAPALRGWFRRRGIGSSDIDDLAQDVLVRMLIAFERGEIVPDGLEGWVFGVARNVRRSYLRRESRAPPPAPPETAGAESIPDRALERQERLRLLRQAVQELPARWRTVVELHYFQGLSQKQVAARLGMPEPSLRTLLHRARIWLRARLDPRR